MGERVTYRPVPPEVAGVRRWMQDEVIAKGFCPPLSRIAQRFTGENGVINWDTLANEIPIVSHHHEDPNGSRLVEKVSSAHYGFILDAVNGAAPATMVTILPDFESNIAYDEFVNKVKLQMFSQMVGTKQGRALSRAAFVRAAEQDKVKQEIIRSTLVNAPETVVLNVVEGAFNPPNFYGQPLQQEDLIGIPDRRGPVERSSVLMRAPYYLIQINNKFRGPELINNLNRQRLWERNTQIALQTDLAVYDNVMRRFRG